MCFVPSDDYAWYAEVVVVEDGYHETGRNVKRKKCVECGCKILEHHWRRHIHAQQNEDMGDDGTYGKEADYFQCEKCVALIAAIKEVELSEGCTEQESVPDIGDLATCTTALRPGMVGFITPMDTRDCIPVFMLIGLLIQWSTKKS